MYAAGSIAAKQEYVICLYIRLSIEDDDVSGNPFKKEKYFEKYKRAGNAGGGHPIPLIV